MLEHSRMAWTEASSHRAGRIQPGNRIVLYVARGAFHNQARDESRLLGLAEATGPPGGSAGPSSLPGVCSSAAVTSASRSRSRNAWACPPGICVGRLSFVRRKEVWGQYFRAGLIEIPPENLRPIHEAIENALMAPRLGHDT